MNTFNLRIVTPDGDFYSGEVEYISVDTPDGKVGYLHGAMPRVAVLSAGRMDIKTSVLDIGVACGDGLIYIDSDGITVITGTCRYSDGAQADTDLPVVDENLSDASASGTIEFAKARIISAVKGVKDKNRRDI